jgi:GDP-4-dehydro-6-deoxy-D-mannose reductase
MGVVWVTGCFGFAGRHLAAELIGRGHQVVAIDRPGRPTPAWARAAAIETLDLDLLDTDAVIAAIGRHRPDRIFHLAAQSSAPESFRAPQQTMRTNVEGTASLLEAIRQASGNLAPPRLLSVGSCEEYGAPDGQASGPIGEEHPLRPASPYAVSKAAQTLLCLQYQRAYALPIVCTRSFTHTGPGQTDRFVFSSFARQIAELERAGRSGVGRLKVGNLEAVRDVSDVRDVVRAYVDLLELAASGTIVNVCSGSGTRIRDGLDLLLGRAAHAIQIEVDPARLRPLDVPVFVGDPTRLRATIGWAPRTSIASTLDDLLGWWREELRRQQRSDAQGGEAWPGSAW